MTWQAPWVWAGALLAAVPVLIHLLSRSSARQQRFPTLRFFADTRIQAVRRSRITDVPLLLLRVLIVLLAVAALAQPHVDSGARQAALAQQVARVVVVDTSASMQRVTPDGVAALAEARQLAASYEGATSVVETASPAATLAGAGQLLARRSGVREIVVISDFQAGTLDAVDVAALPEGTGLQLVRIPVAGAADDGWRFRTTTHAVDATASNGAFRWTRRALPAGSAAAAEARAVMLLASDDEAALAQAIRSAALASVQALPADRRMTLVMPGFGARDSVVTIARPVTSRWMADAVIAATAGRTALAVDGVPPPLSTWPEDNAVLGVAEDANGMLLMVHPEAEPLAISAVLAALLEGAGDATPLRERQVEVTPDDELARLERTAVPATAGTDLDISDGRWLWLLALLLLGVEFVVRRRITAQPGGAA